MNHASHRESILRLVIRDGMSSCNHTSCLLNNLHSSTQHLTENTRIQVFGPGNQINRHQHLASHRINIAEGICGSNRTISIRIIHHRREKISSANNGLLVIDTIHRCIVDRCQPNQQLGRNITLSKRTHNPSQNISANFCSATCTTGKFCEPDWLNDTH